MLKAIGCRVWSFKFLMLERVAYPCWVASACQPVGPRTCGFWRVFDATGECWQHKGMSPHDPNDLSLRFIAGTASR